jgi:hypothetical protein
MQVGQGRADRLPDALRAAALALVAGVALFGCGECGVPEGSGSAGSSAAPAPSYSVIARRQHLPPILEGLHNAQLADAGRAAPTGPTPPAGSPSAAGAAGETGTATAP